MTLSLGDLPSVEGGSGNDETSALPLHEALIALRRTAEDVRALHEQGRLHGHVGVNDLRAGGAARPEPADAAACARFGRGHSCPELCPPELAEADPLELPDSIDAAARLLAEKGHAVDPRRIDLYQLGAAFCRLLTGRSMRAYMYDPRVKAAIPPMAEPLLRRALGYRPDDRFADCGVLIRAVDDALAHLREQETPAAGTGPVAETPPRGQASRPAAAPSAGERPPARGADSPPARLGPFRLIRRIGRGGMADVYEARDESLERTVAVKVLPPELARDESLVRRFRAESEAVARLSHPNIVPVYSVGEEAGWNYFAMQLVDGRSLAQRLDERLRPPLDETLQIVRQCLEGLAAAHGRGLVHRDIKPSNILLEKQTGRVVLVDFGLVRTVGQTSQNTAPGLVMGTVDYIAPEQALGEPVDARADLYAVGVLMYLLLSGRLPFHADTPAAVLLKHAYSEPPALSEVAPGVPDEVAAVVARLMQKDPESRYPSAAEALHDVAALIEGRPTRSVVVRRPAAAATPSRPARARPVGRGRRMLLGAAAAGLVLAVGGAVLGGLFLMAGGSLEPAGPVVAAQSLPPGARLPGSEWVDVLALPEPEWHAVSGTWKRDGKDLVTGPEWYSRMAIPVEIEGSYDLSAELTRVEGDGSVNVLLPVGDRLVCLYLAGWRGTTHGLGLVDGRLPNDRYNTAAVHPGTLINGRPYRLAVSVDVDGQDARIDATLDDRPLVAWSGKQRWLDVQPVLALPRPKRLGLGAVAATVRFSRAELRVRGTATRDRLPEPPVAALDKGRWVDLLGNVDPARDTVRGRWRVAADGIAVAPAAIEEPNNCLMLPEPVGGSYDLLAEFTRSNGDDAVALILPTATRQAALMLSAEHGNRGGLEWIDGMNIYDNRNPALRRPSPLDSGRRYRVLARVRTEGDDVFFDVWLDGRPFLSHSLKEASLGLGNSWPVPERRRVALGTNRAGATFHTVRVRAATEAPPDRSKGGDRP